MTDKELFGPVTVYETVVYNGEGVEVDRLPGRGMVRPRDYAEQLPVEVRIVETTTRVLHSMMIEK